ncbi:GntR family transcriptional regulator [Gordonia sp. NPDC003424]
MAAQTNSDLAYEIVRSAIVRGEFAPGERLRLAELSQRFDFSTGVLREALPRLVAEGFVESRAQLGFRVVELDPTELAHLTEFRLLVELEALRQSVTHGDSEWEAEVVGAHYLLSKAPMTVDGHPSPEWARIHLRFHSALVAACPNPYLRDESTSLRDRGEMFRAWSQPASWLGRDVAEEHRLICEAAVAHDTDLAVDRLRAHIATTTRRLLTPGGEDGSTDVEPAV